VTDEIEKTFAVLLAKRALEHFVPDDGFRAEGEYLAEAGQPLPDWVRLYFSAPWELAHDMIITVSADGSVEIRKSLGAAEHK
jgi:hypothetical protein